MKFEVRQVWKGISGFIILATHREEALLLFGWSVKNESFFSILVFHLQTAGLFSKGHACNSLPGF